VDAVDTDVVIGGNVHFEVGGEINVACVGFEAEPAPAVFGGLGAAAGGADRGFTGKLGTSNIQHRTSNIQCSDPHPGPLPSDGRGGSCSSVGRVGSGFDRRGINVRTFWKIIA